MDENEFRQLMNDEVVLKCEFYKLILSSRGQCKHALKKSLAEREAVACMNTLGHQKCSEFTRRMSEHARFVLRKTDDSPLTHAQLLKVQQGSLEGIREISGLVEQDILQLIVSVEAQYGDIAKLPFEKIARAISNVKVRPG